MTIKEIERKINELKIKKEKANNFNSRKNISNEILELEEEKSKINDNYTEIILNNINSLKTDEIIDIMIINNMNEKEAKEKLFNIILDKYYNNLENYYNTLLFLQENKINKDNIDLFNINVSTLLFARRTLKYIDEVNNRETNDVEIKRINDKIIGLRETIKNNARAVNLFAKLTAKIDNISNKLNSYNNDLDIEVNDLTNKKYSLYNKIDFYKDEAKGINLLKAPFKIRNARKELLAVEELLDIKSKEQKREQDKLDKDTMLIWNNISNEEKEIFFKANCSEEEVILSIKYYIKNNGDNRDPLMIDMMTSTIKRAKSEYQLLTIKKKSLENSTRFKHTNLLMDTKSVVRIQSEAIDNIYGKYPFLEKLSDEELSNIDEAKITTITILAIPKNKIKGK